MVFYPVSLTFHPSTQGRVQTSCSRWIVQRDSEGLPCCIETLGASKVTPSCLSQHVLSFWSQWIQGFPAMCICCPDSKEMFCCQCAHTHKATRSRCVVCGWELREYVLCLSETCFSCSEGCSGYLGIISWAGRERGFVPFEETPPVSLLPLFNVIHHYLHFFKFISSSLLSSCSSLSGS